MKRAFAVAFATAIIATAALAGGASASFVSGVTLSVASTSVTVSGDASEHCRPLTIQVWDELLVPDGELDVSLLGSFFDSQPVDKAGPFSVTFSGLEPNHTYFVAIWDNCDDEEPTFGPEEFTTPAAGGGSTPVPQGPDRYIFCAVAGNTWPDGTPIAPGTSLNLPADQAASDPHYKGATPGFWVPGEGATCSLTPAQAALAGASTHHVNHTGHTGDYNQPEIYTLVG